ncbi:MAG: hypothetical protein P1U87_16450 [Verrucomicrobiales bacterium]|nr:hypothetical protein [Verrucomicrobiales bacterium]
MEPNGFSLRQPVSERGLAFLLAGLALLFQCVPALAESLQWQRDAHPVAGVVTALTGHLTHWTWSHFVWDVAAFLGLSLAAISIAPGRYRNGLFLAAVLIPLEIHFFQPEFQTYRGLSGIDSALFGLLLAGLWQSGGTAKWISAAGLLGFFGKTAFEWITGDTLFVSRSTDDFTPVGSAHVVGMISGVIAGFLPVKSRNVAHHSPESSRFCVEN